MSEISNNSSCDEKKGKTELQLQAEDYLHRCDRCTRYHHARQSYLETLNQRLMVAVLFSSSGAVAVLLAEIGNMWLAIIPITTAFITSYIVVYRPEKKAYEHQLLASRFYELYRSIDTDNPSKDDITNWKNELTKIYENEPPVFHAVNAEAYNAAAQAMGFKSDKFLKIPWYKRLTRHFFRYSVEDFPPSYHSQGEPATN